MQGVNLSISKQVLTGYDSGKGLGAVNTYPSTSLASGQLYDGDWVVYDILAENTGPADAWAPRLTDTLPAGLTVVDFL